MTGWRGWAWGVVVAACTQGVWAQNCEGLTSSISGQLTGAVTFGSTDVTSWTFAPTGTTNLQPDGCNKDSVFRANPSGGSLTGGGAATRSGGAETFPFQLQRLSGATWLPWGNTFVGSGQSSTNVIAVSKTNGPNETPPAVQVRIAGGASPPSFPRKGTYAATVDVERYTLTNQDALDSVVETRTAQVSIDVPFHCALTWQGGVNALVLNYTSFGAAPPPTSITLNVQCNDTYSIGLADNENATTTAAMSLEGSALGLSYTLELSGNAQGGPDLLTANGRTINATLNVPQGGASGDLTPAANNTCAANSQPSGSCSQTNRYYVVIYQ